MSMSIRKKIAIFVGQPDEFQQNEFLTGASCRAFELDTDVCVFAMLKKYQDTVEREKGDSNVFRVANPGMFDGILIMKDTIQTAGAAERLEKWLEDVTDVPVIVVDGESERFPSIFIDGYKPIAELTEHLITDHDVTDIAFLTGKKRHRASKERLAAFLDTMNKHGLSVPKERIIEGDFWYKSGEQCADYFLSNASGKPQAVVCANDQMAIGLCKALCQKGIRIPEDLLVVGADSTPEGQNSPKSISSYLAPAASFGAYAVDCLMRVRKGKEIQPFEGTCRILYGESCGCSNSNMPVYGQKREDWGTELSEEGFDSINNVMCENLLIQTDLNDYVSTVYSYAYQLNGVSSFHLCLVKGVTLMDQVGYVLPKNDGYPDQMIHAIRYNSSYMSNFVSLSETFDTMLMLPELYEERENPAVYCFSPLYFEDECFGYAVVSYDEKPRVYDGIYRRWLGTVVRGLECLRKSMLIENMNEQLSKLRTGKFDKMAGAYDSLSKLEKEEYELVRDILDQNRLNYHFQPIVSAVDGSVYSYEALMRSATTRVISPLSIIKYAGMMDRLTDVETATFENILGIIDKDKEQIGGAKVFINSIPGIRVKNYKELEKRLSEHSDTVVVELTEEAQLGEEELDKLKDFFNKSNVEIAIDDYGTGYSNVSNLLRYMPEYVKIDRSLLSEIQNKPQKQHFVREIIGFCHDNGIKALAEGVETTEELRMVIHLGADLIQGFYTGKPAPKPCGSIDDRIVSEIKSYYQERSDGKEKKTYVAGKTNRVSLLTLVKDECTDIIIGREGMLYNDITIVGMPSMKTDIHILVEPGYCGKITLENVYLSNVKNRPCLDLGEMTDVVCHVEGDNVMHDAGIRVPETARFTLEGNGNLLIELEQDNQEFYGIGNNASSRHGELSFHQDGKITVKGNGMAGVGIGSGLGGQIHIYSGIYNLMLNGIKCVGIGALAEDSKVTVHNCSMDIDLSVSGGVGVGSYDGNAKILMDKTSYKFNGDANEVVGLGSIRGKNAIVKIHDAFVRFSIRAGLATCMGSLYAASDTEIDTASVRAEIAGNKALAFGGYSEETAVRLSSVDTRVMLRNSVKKDTYAPAERFEIENGKCQIIINDEEIERTPTFHFEADE